MTGWTLNPEYATGVSGQLFADLDTVFALAFRLPSLSALGWSVATARSIEGPWLLRI